MKGIILLSLHHENGNGNGAAKKQMRHESWNRNETLCPSPGFSFRVHVCWTWPWVMCFLLKVLLYMERLPRQHFSYRPFFFFFHICSCCSLPFKETHSSKKSLKDERYLVYLEKAQEEKTKKRNQVGVLKKKKCYKRWKTNMSMYTSSASLSSVVHLRVLQWIRQR